jgi:hypothetical protein
VIRRSFFKIELPALYVEIEGQEAFAGGASCVTGIGAGGGVKTVRAGVKQVLGRNVLDIVVIDAIPAGPTIISVVAICQECLKAVACD